MLEIKDIGHAIYRFPGEKVFVCTKCFQLTSLIQGIERCACEPQWESDDPCSYDPTVSLLCVLCARVRVRKGKPYWWQACGYCSKFNGRLQEKVGRGVFLCRMSPTNYALAKRYGANELAIAEMNANIDGWTLEWNVIFAWGRSKARELWESVPEWAKDDFVGLKSWEARFPRSLELSEQMFLEFAGLTRSETVDAAITEMHELEEQGFFGGV
jgi:hypothetical protein